MSVLWTRGCDTKCVPSSGSASVTLEALLCSYVEPEGPPGAASTGLRPKPHEMENGWREGSVRTICFQRSVGRLGAQGPSVLRTPAGGDVKEAPSLSFCGGESCRVRAARNQCVSRRHWRRGQTVQKRVESCRPFQSEGL